jgi:hypothetical protein
MNERFLCIDCHYLGELTKHGLCRVCGSPAVVSEHNHRVELPIGDPTVVGAKPKQCGSRLLERFIAVLTVHGA